MKSTFANFLLNEAQPEILQYLAAHPKGVGKETTVDGLRKALTKAGLRVERSDVIYVLKACAHDGAGKFYVGRHGRKSRIIWLKDRTEVAKKVLEERGQMTGGTGIAPPSQSGTTYVEEEEDSAIMLRYPFMLRNRLEITLELPADLTIQEGTRLSEFIKTLPLGSPEALSK
jgi:hypothetical protein